MRSDIQKLKVYNLYQAFDVEKNGYLDKADVDALAQRIAETQGRAKGSALHAELQTKLYAYWSEMINSLDRDQDGRISQEEFLQFSAKLMKDPKGPESQIIQAVSDVIFTIADQDGSGSIAEREFVLCTRAYGVIDSAALAAFRMIDKDRSGRITREEWATFMNDVFQSQSLNDASALVFGPGSRART